MYYNVYVHVTYSYMLMHAVINSSPHLSNTYMYMHMYMYILSINFTFIGDIPDLMVSALFCRAHSHSPD